MNRFHALAFSLIGTACGSIFATDFDEAAGVTLFAFDSVAKTAIAGLPDRIRLKVSFEGEQKTKIHFSALYVQPIIPAK